ncbi:MAG: 5-guanidino-2-oxopentanoate decarboxylase [Ilumatobacteraceae bacterium]
MSERLRVGEAVIDLLARHYGVDTAFGIPGVHNIELFRGLHRSGIRTIAPRHEQGAGFMADGWSVVTGRPGICVLISGPGLTNALTPMAQAYHDSRPMLVLASTTPTDALGRRIGPLHDLDDQAAVARTVCAFSETVLDPADLPALIARAWDVFTAARPKPVHLAIPTDVLEQLVDQWAPVPSTTMRPVADPAAVDRAATVLAAARNPLVIAGGGAIDAGEALVRIAEQLDAPVVLTGNAKGVMASDHPLCADTALGFPEVQRAIEACDAVLVVGTELSDTDLYNGGRALAFTGRTVRIDLDPEQAVRRLSPDVTLVGDAAATLRSLGTALEAAGVGHRFAISEVGGERAAALRSTWRAGTRADLVPWLDAIESCITPDTIVALDSTQLGYAAHTWLPAAHPRSWLAPYGFGTLGCALPMAIGASIAAPDRPVVALAGDGGWLFTVAEMAAAHDLASNLVLLVWDNRGYAQIRQSFDDVDAVRMGVDVSSHDPAAIARGFGWAARTVDNADELAGALRTALGAAARGEGPQCLHLMPTRA